MSSLLLFTGMYTAPDLTNNCKRIAEFVQFENLPVALSENGCEFCSVKWNEEVIITSQNSRFQEQLRTREAN